jgi:uroporphyrinogen decarboxylase
VVRHLEAQIEAGAQVVQLFDTWAGLLGRDEYREWVLPIHQEIAAKLDRRRAPLILFAGSAPHVVDLMADSGADVLSLDWRVDFAEAARRVGSRVSLQGNLDPCALCAPADEIARRVRALVAAGRAARGHVLNLGHGVLPETPVEGVRAFTSAVRALGGDA